MSNTRCVIQRVELRSMGVGVAVGGFGDTGPSARLGVGQSRQVLGGQKRTAASRLGALHPVTAFVFPLSKQAVRFANLHSLSRSVRRARQGTWTPIQVGAVAASSTSQFGAEGLC